MCAIILVCYKCGAQSPLKMDSTGSIVYYERIQIKMGQESEALNIFIRFCNLNFKKEGRIPIVFKNSLNNSATAKGYFPMTMLNKMALSLPAEGEGRFTWYFIAENGLIHTYLFKVYFTSDSGGGYADASATAEWMHDSYNELITASKGADKVNTQLRHYIKLLKDSLTLLDK